MYNPMYEIRDRQDPVKGSGWVLFSSTMAEQPIQQVCMCMIKILLGAGAVEGEGVTVKDA